MMEKRTALWHKNSIICNNVFPITTEPISMKALEVTTFLLSLLPYFKAHNSWAGDLFLVNRPSPENYISA
jgi:hypothetical protein